MRIPDTSVVITSLTTINSDIPIIHERIVLSVLVNNFITELITHSSAYSAATELK